MKMERYYYTEYKEETAPRIREMQEHLLLQQEIMQKLPQEEQKQLHEAEKEYLSEIMPLPSEVCALINPTKYRLFTELAEESLPLAKELGANLWIDSNDTTGCITFVGEELNYIGTCKDILKRLTDAADEVHTAQSVDTGEGSPIDIDGAVRMEFWFDFYIGII